MVEKHSFCEGFLKIMLKKAAKKAAQRRQYYKVICIYFITNSIENGTSEKTRNPMACGAETCTNA